MYARVGGHVVKANTDAFAIVAFGAGGRFENDLFLLFRGTTSANKKADRLTDARYGASISSTGHSLGGPSQPLQRTGATRI